MAYLLSNSNQLATLLNAAIACVRAITARRTDRATCAQMLRLNDRELADIGVTRSDVYQRVLRPVH